MILNIEIVWKKVIIFIINHISMHISLMYENFSLKTADQIEKNASLIKRSKQSKCDAFYKQILRLLPSY